MYICMNMFIYIRLYMRTSTYVCMYIYIYVYVYTHMHIIYIYICHNRSGHVRGLDAMLSHPGSKATASAAALSVHASPAMCPGRAHRP